MKYKRPVEFDYYFCRKCRNYVYDETSGDAERGISPNTHVKALGDAWRCPVCGTGKEDLCPVTMLDHHCKTEDACEAEDVSKDALERT